MFRVIPPLPQKLLQCFEGEILFYNNISTFAICHIPYTLSKVPYYMCINVYMYIIMYLPYRDICRQLYIYIYIYISSMHQQRHLIKPMQDGCFFHLEGIPHKAWGLASRRGLAFHNYSPANSYNYRD